MSRILKYPVNTMPGVAALVIMTKGAKVLKVDQQRGVPTIWAEVDENKPRKMRSVAILGTGSEVPENWDHAGTFLDGPFVWHMYIDKTEYEVNG